MEESGKKNIDVDDIFEKVLAGLEMDQKKEKDFDFDPFEPEL